MELALGSEPRSDTRRGAAVLFIDLDNFKLVNDSFGHAAGDELLKAVGARLQAATPKMVVVARQGGDELLVLLSDLERHPREEIAFLSAADVVASKMRRILRAPFLGRRNRDSTISASVGISIYPSDADDAETLLKHADVAMYSVKDAGRDGYTLYRHRARTRRGSRSPWQAVSARPWSVVEASSCTISRSSISKPQRSSVWKLSSAGRTANADLRATKPRFPPSR